MPVNRVVSRPVRADQPLASGRVRTTWTLLLLLAGLVAFGGEVSIATADEQSELRQRFRDRYARLEVLKRQGKVGETAEGSVDAVRSLYLREKVRPSDPESPTVGEFIGEENRDREALYELIAKRTGASPRQVAKQNALRNFEKADVGEWLRGEDRRWYQKPRPGDRE